MNWLMEACEWWIEELNWTGLITAVCTFLIIGVAHPIVIKTEYYFGMRLNWVFGLVGAILLIFSLLVEGTMATVLLGVASCTCFWSIHELREQQERVHKGWFPRNPKRRYPWDDEK